MEIARRVMVEDMLIECWDRDFLDCIMIVVSCLGEYMLNILRRESAASV